MSNFETARPLITGFIFASPGLWLSSCLLVVSLTGGRAKCFLPNSDATLADWCRDSLFNVHSAPEPVVDVLAGYAVSSRPLGCVLGNAIDGQRCRLPCSGFSRNAAARLRAAVSQAVTSDRYVLGSAGAIA